jgi:HTH-type transcriptional regulator/antitoxin HigA
MTGGDGKMTAVAKLSPTKYARLLARAQPVVIETEAEYKRMLDQLDRLWDKDLTREESRLFDLLVRLIQDYEDRNYPPLDAATPLDMLKHLMEARDVAPKDLWEPLGSKGATSEILSGKRGVSKAQAKRLAAFFNVSVELFI